MTAGQALQLLYLHQKEARLLAEPAHLKRRRGESREAHCYRMAVMHEARIDRDREAVALAEAARRARGEPSPWEPAPPTLPSLDQVTGWSTAGQGRVHDPDVALFGGWRLGRLGKGGGLRPRASASRGSNGRCRRYMRSSGMWSFSSFDLGRYNVPRRGTHHGGKHLCTLPIATEKLAIARSWLFRICPASVYVLRSCPAGMPMPRGPMMAETPPLLPPGRRPSATELAAAVVKSAG